MTRKVDTMSKAERRVINEAMGWHARKPFNLRDWLDTPDVLIAAIKRIDDACAELEYQRERGKR